MHGKLNQKNVDLDRMKPERFVKIYPLCNTLLLSPYISYIIIDYEYCILRENWIGFEIKTGIQGVTKLPSLNSICKYNKFVLVFVSQLITP